MRLPCRAARGAIRSAVALSAATAPIELVTFDCTGTLFEPTRSVGELYKAALVAEAQKLGLDTTTFSSLDERALDDGFAEAYAAAASIRPCFGALTSIARTSEGWWRPLVQETYVRGGVARDALAPAFPGAFDYLYNTAFVTTDGWRLRPHARQALEQLSRRAGGARHVGVISNWDERLPLLLQRLGIAHTIDFVVASRLEKVEKPSREIFDRARALAGVSAEARCVHVGDSFALDVQGAVDAGFEAVWIAPPAKAVAAARGATPHLYLSTLETLPDALEWFG